MTASRLRRAGDRALTVAAVLGGLFAVVGVLTLVLDLRLLTFRSGSMAPTIETGALGVARSTPAEDLRVGDVVSVRTASGSRVTHRIVRIEREGAAAVLELRGDANRTSDAAPSRVRSADRLWFAVPWVGRPLAVLTGPVGWLLLGGYVAVLSRLVFARRSRGGPPRHRRTGGHRAVGAPAAAALALVVAGVGGLGPRVQPTLASWTDPVATTGSSFATATIPAPATFQCSGLGLFSVSFSWSAVPGATSYTLHYGSGGQNTLTTTATNATITAVVAGGTAWVTARRDFGATTWTSVGSTTRSYTVAVISLCG